MKGKVVTITPKLARQWLQKNTNNRHAQPQAIARYVEDILAGLWKVNGETIKFNCDGTLADGQNRLLSILQADTPIRSWVVWGVDEDAFDTIDNGEPRTMGHVFSRRKEKHYNVLASAVRWIWSMSNMKANRRQKMRHSVGLQLLKENPTLRESVAFISSKKMSKTASSSLMSALHYLCSQKDALLADQYFEAIATGEHIAAKSPAYKLRERIMDGIKAGQRIPLEQIAAETIIGWNALRQRKTPRSIAWDGVEFPDIQ